MNNMTEMRTRNMYVTKRNNKLEEMSFDKITARLMDIGKKMGIENLDYTSLVMKVISQLYDRIPTSQIDEFIAENCAMLAINHPNYALLAKGLIISNYQLNTEPQLVRVMDKLHKVKDKRGDVSPQISTDLYKYVKANKDWINSVIDHNRDYLIDYFGFKTLEKSYLLKINGVAVERIQHLWMRVAIGIHLDLTKYKKSDDTYREELKGYIKETYDYMSQKYFIHATPTLYNAGTPMSQLSSCFLLAMEDDSIEGIYKTLMDCALISKYSGGIGLHIHNIRGNGSFIRGTNGTSNGIVPMLRVFNNTAKYVNQAGRRMGSIAVYLEPHHVDILEFLDMKKNHGNEDTKARDLFYGLWISDLFMERVKADTVENPKMWSLFCPDECPGLCDVWGDEYKALYEKYEKAGRARATIKVKELWFKILDAQMETGMPYIMYKDHVNRKSNQKNVGIIKSSNLCTEIVEYSDKKETAVCNLASIGLPSFIKMTEGQSPVKKYFDYNELVKVVRVIVRNLNRIIDINYYPTEKTKVSNMRHRPIGIGVQGLADVFMLLNVAFDSVEAKIINKNIFETIYFAALDESCELAIVKGPYETFVGSPASEGILQFDLWGKKQTDDRHNWTDLKQKIIKNGLRNSLLIAPMPTASTSQIFGFNECIEPITNNIYARRTLAGEFIVINKYLIMDLIELGLWNENLKNQIIANDGSVQGIDYIPSELRQKYKTVWEMSMKPVLEMAADRGQYICQSQSLNLWLAKPNYANLTSMHFTAWELGLKTGIYYLRRRGVHSAQKFTIDPKLTVTAPQPQNTVSTIEQDIVVASSTVLSKIDMSLNSLHENKNEDHHGIHANEGVNLSSALTVKTETMDESVYKRALAHCKAASLENGGACELCSS